MSILYLFLALVPLFFSSPETDYKGSINAVIGYASASDISADAYALLSGQERIRRHLSYVLEELNNAPDAYSPDLYPARMRMIALLEEYISRGAFPVNEKYPGRRPCFIDDYGNICAVGYLVQQTAGDQVAREIDKQHRYDYIADMDMAELDTWIASSGLSRKEVAMIQPTYDFYERGDYVVVEPFNSIRKGDIPFYGIGLGFYKFYGIMGKNGYWRYWGIQSRLFEEGWRMGVETESVLYGLKQTPLYATTGMELNYLALDESGLQATPNAGIAVRLPRMPKWTGMMLFNYGYDIPLINQDFFTYNRHRFELGLRMGIRI